MDKLIDRFSLYDQLGYLLVGALAIMFAIIDSFLIGMKIPDLTTGNLLGWVTLAYFCGHMAQSLSNIIIRENKNGFTKQDSTVLADFRKYIGVEKDDESELFSLCYMLMLNKGFNSHVEVFNAQYSLYRGWLSVSILELIFIFFLAIANISSTSVWLLLIVNIIVCYLLWTRMRRFSKYFREKVLQSYILVRALNM